MPAYGNGGLGRDACQVERQHAPAQIGVGARSLGRSLGVWLFFFGTTFFGLFKPGRNLVEKSDEVVHESDKLMGVLLVHVFESVAVGVSS